MSFILEIMMLWIQFGANAQKELVIFNEILSLILDPIEHLQKHQPLLNW